jgi:hypothetical protein
MDACDHYATGGPEPTQPPPDIGAAADAVPRKDSFPKRKMRVRGSEVFRHLTGWMLAFAILVFSIESAVAESITVRVVSTSPAKPVDGHSKINVTLDYDSAIDLARFTSAHVGQDIEVRSEGKLLMKV